MIRIAISDRLATSNFFGCAASPERTRPADFTSTVVLLREVRTAGFGEVAGSDLRGERTGCLRLGALDEDETAAGDFGVLRAIRVESRAKTRSAKQKHSQREGQESFEGGRMPPSSASDKTSLRKTTAQDKRPGICGRKCFPATAAWQDLRIVRIRIEALGIQRGRMNPVLPELCVKGGPLDAEFFGCFLLVAMGLL